MQMNSGLTGRVRECISGFSKRKTFSASAVAKLIGQSNAFAVQAVFSNLMERGEIIKEARGKYRYKGASGLGKKEGPITSRIFRAMHVSRIFSARDITVLSDSTRSFVYKLIRVLVASGEITGAGVKENINGRLEATYRIKNRDDFYLKHLIGGNH
jgi:hypothetical protein